MEVLPCLELPAVHLLFADNSGNTYYDHNFDRSILDTFRVPASKVFNVLATLNVTVHQLPGTGAFAVSLPFSFCKIRSSLVSIYIYNCFDSFCVGIVYIMLTARGSDSTC